MIPYALDTLLKWSDFIGWETRFRMVLGVVIHPKRNQFVRAGRLIINPFLVKVVRFIYVVYLVQDRLHFLQKYFNLRKPIC